ncbi:MAG: WecB/TagA/CpsF family glycosyltransferase [Cyclobacteriaceae bacterium]
MNSNTSKTGRKALLGTSITTGSYRDLLDAILSLAEKKIPSYVCFANVHMVVEAHRDPSFQKLLHDAAVVAPDGKPVSLLLRLTQGLKQDRVCGMDMFPDILARAEASEKSVYFYGTTPQLLARIAEKARKEFPALKIAGYHSPPFRALSEREKCDIISMINEANPDLVFVSLGCPKQERWMAENRNKIGACLLGLGQAFKVYAGEEKRLPKWMRDLALEWAYRLYLEPGRLWKRYLYTNTIFLMLAMRDIIGGWWRRRSPEERRHLPTN